MKNFSALFLAAATLAFVAAANPIRKNPPSDTVPDDDPVSLFERLLPPRFRRKLGLTSNPLSCQGDTLAPGHKLAKGQAACWQGYEFGLADNGKITFFDHWNHHPEVVIWQEPDVKGSYLYMDWKGFLILFDDKGNAVWEIGGGTGPVTMTVTEGGVVELSDGEDFVHWRLNLKGEISGEFA
jgi:hypothetical protein